MRGKAPRVVTVTDKEARELRSNHIYKCMSVVTEAEMYELRRRHVARALIPFDEAKAIRVAHIAKVEPELMLRLRLCRESLNLMEQHRVEFGLEDIPERIILKLDKVVAEPDNNKARDYARRAWKSMEIHCLAAWATGWSDGPRRVDTQVTSRYT